jgi:hypothetical protein
MLGLLLASNIERREISVRPLRNHSKNADPGFYRTKGQLMTDEIRGHAKDPIKIGPENSCK